MSNGISILTKQNNFTKLLNYRLLFDALFYLGITILAFGYVKNNLHGSVDDSYITYRYAQNFISGNGLVFNVGEKFYGSTAMGFALLLGAATIILQSIQQILDFEYPVTIPRVAVAISGLSLWAIGALWYHTLTHFRFSLLRWLVGVAIAAYFLVSVYSSLAPGHETYTFFALLTMSAYLFFFARQRILSALILAFSFMVRPDTLLFALCIVLIAALQHFYFLKKGSTEFIEILNFAVVFGILAIAWEIFLRLYFGSWLPETMIAKKAQMVLGYWKLFSFSSVLNAFQNTAFPGFLLLLAFALGTFAFYSIQTIIPGSRLLDEERTIFFLMTCLWLCFGVGLILAYSSFHVTLWRWYEIPIYFGLLSALITSLFLFADYVDGTLIGNSRYKIIIPISILLFFAIRSQEVFQYMKSRWEITNENLHISSYDPVVDYLHKEEPAGTSVATAEPGALGYKLGEKYQIVDYLGLISPGVAESIISGNRKYYFQKWKPKYIIVSWEGSYAPLDDQWFEENYQLIHEFNHPYWSRNINRGVFLFKLKDNTSLNRLPQFSSQ